MPPPKDYTNQSNGKLTALYPAGHRFYQSGKKYLVWLFQCQCGNLKALSPDKVFRAKSATKSCGCTKETQYKGVQATAYGVFRANGYDDGNLTFQQFLKLSQQPCHYCHKPPSNQTKGRNSHPFIYTGLDRLDNNQPHNLNNIQPCCWTCNDLMSNTNKEAFFNHIEIMLINYRKNK